MCSSLEPHRIGESVPNESGNKSMSYKSIKLFQVTKATTRLTLIWRMRREGNAPMGPTCFTFYNEV